MARPMNLAFLWPKSGSQMNERTFITQWPSPHKRRCIKMDFILYFEADLKILAIKGAVLWPMHKQRFER